MSTGAVRMEAPAARPPHPWKGDGGRERRLAAPLDRTIARAFGAAILSAVCIQPVPGRGAVPDDARDLILGATLARDGKAITILTAGNRRRLDPGHRDTAFAGYQGPVVSPDRHAAAW